VQSAACRSRYTRITSNQATLTQPVISHASAADGGGPQQLLGWLRQFLHRAQEQTAQRPRQPGADGAGFHQAAVRPLSTAKIARRTKLASSEAR
jgi:HPt (histidine-containing phosphotransfer) domain-containing protein